VAATSGYMRGGRVFVKTDAPLMSRRSIGAN